MQTKLLTSHPNLKLNVSKVVEQFYSITSYLELYKKSLQKHMGGHVTQCHCSLGQSGIELQSFHKHHTDMSNIETDQAGEVECVRYLVVFTIFSLVGLVVDPLPKFFPGFFIVNILWTLANSPCLSQG